MNIDTLPSPATGGISAAPVRLVANVIGIAWAAGVCSIRAANWGPGRLDEWINAPEICRPVARQRANTRLERFERLRMQATRAMAERRRGGRGPDAVELLYSEIMHPPPPARLDAEIFRCNARTA